MGGIIIVLNFLWMRVQKNENIIRRGDIEDLKDRLNYTAGVSDE